MAIGNMIKIGGLVLKILKINGNKLLVEFNEKSTGITKQRWVSL